MGVKVFEDRIEIDKDFSFNIKDTLTCGQVFRWKKIEEGYILYETDNKITLTEVDNKIIIKTKKPKKHYNYFDLSKNYDILKGKYKGYSKLIDDAIVFGSGIVILKQNPVEALMSFIISANNNIPKIQKTIENICSKFGSNCTSYYAFPTLEQLANMTEEDFKNAGAGYRSSQLVKTIKMLLNGFDLEKIKELETDKCRQELLKLSGVGPKVADCVMLFGLNKNDVFPVDTWIKKIYNQDFQGREENIVRIAKYFTDLFKEDSGIIQQYLFNYKRNYKEG